MKMSFILRDEKSLFSVYSEGRNGSQAVEKRFKTGSLLCVIGLAIFDKPNFLNIGALHN